MEACGSWVRRTVAPAGAGQWPGSGQGRAGGDEPTGREMRGKEAGENEEQEGGGVRNKRGRRVCRLRGRRQN